MSKLLVALLALLPEGMDLDDAIVVLIRAFPTLTRQEIKVSLYRSVAEGDEEIAAELSISAVTVGEHARQAKIKLGFDGCRPVGPRLLVHLHKQK
jgi:hypothetical protein